MTSSGPSGPLAVGVVVPARDEAARIDRCLAAVTAAAGMLRRSREAPTDVRVVVVADACADRTVDRLAGWPGVGTVISSAGRVGSARAAGVRQLLRLIDVEGLSPRCCWIANTDADCVVSPDWLTVHAGAARRGRHLLLGTVRPDPDEIDPRLAGRWYRRHRLTDGHPHVHGANLGVRADWYLAVGGLPAAAFDEDIALAEAVVAAGASVERTGAAPVRTSARLVGRAPHGLSSYLRGLDPPPLEPYAGSQGA